jgi:DNA-binding transcriptional ArsR family regulator
MSTELLQPLVGNLTAARVLTYIANYGEGYAAGIGGTFGISASQVQKQLDRLEQGGILVQRLQGRTRVYTWNPRWPLYRELLALLQKCLMLTPERETQTYFRQRTRPRLKGKSYETLPRHRQSD